MKTVDAVTKIAKYQGWVQDNSFAPSQIKFTKGNYVVRVQFSKNDILKFASLTRQSKVGIERKFIVSGTNRFEQVVEILVAPTRPPIA